MGVSLLASEGGAGLEDSLEFMLVKNLLMPARVGSELQQANLGNRLEMAKRWF